MHGFKADFSVSCALKGLCSLPRVICRKNEGLAMKMATMKYIENIHQRMSISPNPKVLEFDFKHVCVCPGLLWKLTVDTFKESYLWVEMSQMFGSCTVFQSKEWRKVAYVPILNIGLTQIYLPPSSWFNTDVSVKRWWQRTDFKRLPLWFHQWHFGTLSFKVPVSFLTALNMFLFPISLILDPLSRLGFCHC